MNGSTHILLPPREEDGVSISGTTVVIPAGSDAKISLNASGKFQIIVEEASYDSLCAKIRALEDELETTLECVRIAADATRRRVSECQRLQARLDELQQPAGDYECYCGHMASDHSVINETSKEMRCTQCACKLLIDAKYRALTKEEIDALPGVIGGHVYEASEPGQLPLKPGVEIIMDHPSTISLATNTMSADDIRDINELLSKHPALEDVVGATIEVNDNNVVTVRDSFGHAVLHMPLEDYRAIVAVPSSLTPEQRAIVESEDRSAKNAIDSQLPLISQNAIRKLADEIYSSVAGSDLMHAGYGELAQEILKLRTSLPVAVQAIQNLLDVIENTSMKGALLYASIHGYTGTPEDREFNSSRIEKAKALLIELKEDANG